MVYIDLIINLSLLVALTIVSGFIENRTRNKPLLGTILQGLLFGGSAVMGMLRPVQAGNGVIFDGRSVMISLCALYHGPVAALISVLMTGALRWKLGGGGMLMGLLVIIMTATNGLLFRQHFQPHKEPPTSKTLYLFGLTIHIQMILLMLTLPRDMIIPTLKSLGPPVLLIYPFAVVLAGKILSDQVTARLQLQALAHRGKELEEVLDFIPVPVSIAHADGSIQLLNRKFIETFGYTNDQLRTTKDWSTLSCPDPVYRERTEKKWVEDIKEAEKNGTCTKPRMYSVTCQDNTVRQVSITMCTIQDLRLVAFEDNTEREHLELMLRKKVQELAISQEAIINSMAIISEFRDTDTGSHIQRTKLYVREILNYMGDHIEYPAEERELIWRSAPLHDIGKVAIPDNILLKQGPLTIAESELMKQHPKIGSDAIHRTQEHLGGNTFLRFAAEIAEYHHEKWDGSGYPHGCRGTDIPLSARIMAIADVYDACISERPYKKAIPHDTVVQIICSGSGTHFDPQLVLVFREVADEFNEIAKKIQ